MKYSLRKSVGLCHWDFPGAQAIFHCIFLHSSKYRYSRVQYSTLQYSTVQYSSLQYSLLQSRSQEGSAGVSRLFLSRGSGGWHLSRMLPVQMHSMLPLQMHYMVPVKMHCMIHVKMHCMVHVKMHCMVYVKMQLCPLY